MASKAGWYPDPWGAHKLRHWDGDTWTARVTDTGPILERPVWEGQGTLFSEPVLVVHRWSTGSSAARALSGTARIYGHQGRSLARAEEAVVSVADQMLALAGGAGADERWDVAGEDGQALLTVSRGPLELRPLEYTFRRGDGTEIARLVQDLAQDGTFTAYSPREPVGVVRIRPEPGQWWTLRDPAGTLLAVASPQTWADVPSGERHVVELPARLAGIPAELVAACAIALDGELVRRLL